MTTISMTEDEMLAAFLRNTCSEEELGVGIVRWPVFESRFMSFKSAKIGQGPWTDGGDESIFVFNLEWNDEVDADGKVW